MGEWRDIKTAPKDGRVLIVLALNGMPCTGAWSERLRSVEKPRRWWFSRREYETESDTGWRISVPARDLSTWVVMANAALPEPTHWMPLPAPPALSPEEVK